MSANTPRKGKPKKKLGRPPLPEGAGKEFMLRVRIPIAMKEGLAKVATDENMTASEFVRKLIEARLSGC